MGIEIPGWGGQMVIVAPFALLALVVLLFLRRRGDPAPSPFPGDIGRDGIPAGRQAGWSGPLVHDGGAIPPLIEPPLHPPLVPYQTAPPAVALSPPAEAAQAVAPPSRPESAPPSIAPANGSTVTPFPPPARPAASPAPPAADPPVAPATVSAETRSAPRSVPAGPAAPPAQAPLPPADEQAPAANGKAPPQQRAPSLAEIEGALQRAEAGGRENDVALLSLYLARRRKAEGVPDYIEGIRRCIRLAAQLGLKELHGEARLDLGDEARASGDLTTACEHWQIARALFDEAKLPVKRDNAEARMKRFGCPTDWVLNDF